MKRLSFLSRLVTILIFVFGFSQVSDAQSRVDRVLINEAQRISQDRFTVSTRTPKGTQIYAVSQPGSRMLDAIDKGLEDLFAVARKNNYRNRLNFSDYTIFIARTDRTMDSQRQYSPDIAVPLNQYAGSIYDQGGFIYAAGIVVAHNPSAFMIAEHSRDFQRVSDVVRYEGEHLVLYHNDRRLYQQTADHSRGGGHPILK
ncbi:MAG TPA: hypothetical protein VK892_14600 [Pyrinomonadaceae bacterium]|nr:hypothetical protein [Pyrinomonadaceae bacterium]